MSHHARHAQTCDHEIIDRQRVRKGGREGEICERERDIGTL